MNGEYFKAVERRWIDCFCNTILNRISRKLKQLIILS